MKYILRICNLLIDGFRLMLLQSRAADAAAWLQQGIAHRLALDMGLNFDATSVTGSKYVNDEEVELRRHIYWALYCTDKLHASYSVRVCTMLVCIRRLLLHSLPESFNN